MDFDIAGTGNLDSTGEVFEQGAPVNRGVDFLFAQIAVVVFRYLVLELDIFVSVTAVFQNKLAVREIRIAPCVVVGEPKGIDDHVFHSHYARKLLITFYDFAVIECSVVDVIFDLNPCVYEPEGRAQRVNNISDSCTCRNGLVCIVPRGPNPVRNELVLADRMTVFGNEQVIAVMLHFLTGDTRTGSPFLHDEPYGPVAYNVLFDGNRIRAVEHVETVRITLTVCREIQILVVLVCRLGGLDSLA